MAEADDETDAGWRKRLKKLRNEVDARLNGWKTMPDRRGQSPLDLKRRLGDWKLGGLYVSGEKEQGWARQWCLRQYQV